MPVPRATLAELEPNRPGTPDRGARAGQARARRGHPRYATRLCVHGLLRRVHREQPAPGQGDLGRGARAAQGGRTACCRARPKARPRRRGSSATTWTSCSTSSRPRRASSTASRICGTTSRTRRSKQPRPETDLSSRRTTGPSRWALDLVLDVLVSGHGDVVAVPCRGCRRGRDGFIHRGYSAGEIDAIAAFCLGTATCYLLPKELSVDRSRRSASPRAVSQQPANRDQLACDFELGATLKRLRGPIAQLGER